MASAATEARGEGGRTVAAPFVFVLDREGENAEQEEEEEEEERPKKLATDIRVPKAQEVQMLQ
jgi:hypothetical protein